MAFILALAAGFPGFTFAETVKEDITVQINGVDIKGEANHWVPGKVWVDAAAYAETLGLDYKFSSKKKAFTINGETLTVKMFKGKPTVHIRAITDATGAENLDWDQKAGLAYVLDLPDGSIALEGTDDVYAPGVPGMGQHWGMPTELPTGPIFGVEQGRLVFIEQMISQGDFVNGKNHLNIPGMKGLPSPPVEHTDIEYLKAGHPGFEIAHFDIHHYFVTHEEHLKFSPVESGETGHGH
ncbi:hypothetical protein [Cytobacillus oceanisediminis]|uniref:hypothetical protein n=1 Tax=Cytobacillus oceanisediminis TaxID=665099 RepID=UPI0037362391